MDEPGFTLKHTRVCIVGLGLMGGSMALALRGRVADLAAVDADAATCDAALRRGIVSRAATDLSLVTDANLVILAAPVRALIDLIGAIGPRLAPGTIVLDLGSVKLPVVQAMNALPDHIGAVGGHPMCGREHSGLDHADSTLFRDARFVLCRTQRTTSAAWALCEEVVGAVGALGVEMDAAHHDRIAAVISHLPYVLSAALASTAGCHAEQDPAAWVLAASGFRDASRLAASDPTMMLDILLSNAAAVLSAIGEAQAHLNLLAALIEEADADRLHNLLAEAQSHRRGWEAAQNGHQQVGA